MNIAFTLLLVWAAVSSTQGKPAAAEQLRRCTEASKVVPNFCSFAKVKERCASLCIDPVDILDCGVKGLPMRSDEEETSGEEVDEVRNENNEDDDSEERIIGGNEADPGEWPWQASLRVEGRTSEGTVIYRHPDIKTGKKNKGKAKGKNRQWCAGAIIAEDLILTAAHCLSANYTSDKTNEWVVVVGDHDLKVNDPEETKHRVTKIINNPKFSTIPFNTTGKQKKIFMEAWPNDVALWVLKEKIDMTKVSVGRVCLPNKKAPVVPGDACTVVGWGHTSYDVASATGGDDDTKPVKLQEGKVEVVSRAECNRKDVYDGFIPESVLCAGYKAGGVDACQFDSGGSLVCPKMNKWYATGIVSTGYGCGLPNAYGLYTNLGSQSQPTILSWIVEKMLTH